MAATAVTAAGLGTTVGVSAAQGPRTKAGSTQPTRCTKRARNAGWAGRSRRDSAQWCATISRGRRGAGRNRKCLEHILSCEEGERLMDGCYREGLKEEKEADEEKQHEHENGHEQ
ncbi:hypothetical protein NEOLEDRAFT_1244358 [Neolentinus lepideus HHB14362 ss-1]|uniref:Uncharacterized protein n=1 Tax=Neolentinus lepideus HHB14362 ss-1 TaxID=1314782 RepID=A0A165Q0U9_9AGAM|nr:hypothetical protein NEOLEDRAFT_1244358 [Neolentinus lepideus HHB14362 ss-1]